VANGVYADDRIKRLRSEVKWAACIGNRKSDSIGQAALPHPHLRDSYGGGFEVDTVDPATRAFRDP
jgi:hypothetical protein